MRTPRWRSLWWRAVGVSLVVAAAPMVFILLANWSDATVGDRMLAETQQATRRAQIHLEANTRVPVRLSDVAKTGRVRIRVLDEAGLVLHDVDHEAGSGLTFALGSVFFAPDDAPTLAIYDTDLPPLGERLEVALAWEVGQDGGCDFSERRKLLVCHHARRVQTPLGPRMVVAHESSRRAIRALYDLRYQMAKLTIFQLLFAGLLGVWLGWRMVRPIEALRAQVLARTVPTVRTDPVELQRNDEVGDLATAFNELLGALRNRNQANKSFAEDLAHEMKNPVAAIRTAAQALEGPVDAKRAARLRRILDASSQNLDKVITGFLELARAEAGLPDQERYPVDLAALARGLGEVFHAQHDELVIRVEGPPSAPVRGAPSELEAAIRNLVSNACSFAETTVTLRVVDESDHVRVEVQDDGPGPEAEDLPHLFERFFSRRQGGTGLGLAMTRAVVEAHGGQVVATSVHGALFTLRIPKMQV